MSTIEIKQGIKCLEKKNKVNYSNAETILPHRKIGHIIISVSQMDYCKIKLFYSLKNQNYQNY